MVFLEIDGLALPVLRRAMRDGNAPTMARWLADGSHRLAEWETDLSSQTGASQAGILLGSNDDIPAFRWVEKETATLDRPARRPPTARRSSAAGPGAGCSPTAARAAATCSRARPTHVILTVSRMDAEKRANPGYRAFFANGFNVLARAGPVLLRGLRWSGRLPARASRRDVRPRGHRGGLYPFMRAAICVVVRDLIVYGVLGDMMKGRPASTRPSRATTRSRTTPAWSGRTRSRRCGSSTSSSPGSSRRGGTRRGRTRSSCSPTTARRRARRSSSATATASTSSSSARSSARDVAEIAGGDEQSAMVGHAVGEATGRKRQEARQERRLRPRRRSCSAPATSGSST